MSKKRKPTKPDVEAQLRSEFPFPVNQNVAEFQMMTERLYGGLEGWGSDGGIGGVSGGWWGPYRGLLAIPSVNRAVKLIAGVLGDTPLAQFRQQAGGTLPPKQVYPTPSFISDPAAGVDTYATVMSAWAVDYLLGGDAIGIIAGTNVDGTPTGWFPVAANMVQVAYVNGSTGTTFTNVYDSVATGLPDAIIYRIGSLIVPSQNVLHVKNLNAPGSLRGAGVLETSLPTLKRARDMDSAAGEVSRNGVPTGVLSASSPDTTREQLSAAKFDWIRKQSIGEVAALAPGVTFTPLSWNPEERQLLDARKYNDVQVAQLFGLPLGFLQQGVGGLNYATANMDSRSFLQWCMNDIFNRFEQAISAHLPRGNYARFDRDSVIIQDPAEQMVWITQAIAANVLLRSEARSMLGLPPIDGIDEMSGAAPSPTQADALTAEPAPVVAAPVAPVGAGNEQTVVTDNPTEDLPSATDGNGSPGQFSAGAQSNASGGVKV